MTVVPYGADVEANPFRKNETVYLAMRGATPEGDAYLQKDTSGIVRMSTPGGVGFGPALGGSGSRALHGECDIGAEYGFLPTNTATKNASILSQAMTDATAGAYGLYLPAGQFPIDPGVHWNATICHLRGAGSGRTILVPSSNSDHGLQLGSGAAFSENGQGYVADFQIFGGVPGVSLLPLTVTGKAALLINGLKFSALERVAVAGFDIGFDAIGNIFGSYGLNLWARYAQVNCGLNLRTGGTSGNDLPFYNCWIGGAIAGVSISPNSTGFNFFGGQFGASGAGADGSIVLCHDYISGSDTGGVGNVSFNGVDFEGFSGPAIKSYSPFSLSMRDCHFLGTNVANPATQIVDLTTFVGDSQLSFDSCEVSGTFTSAALMSMSGTISSHFQLRESGWSGGTPTVINGSSQSIGWMTTLAEQSSLPYGSGLNVQGGNAYLLLGGTRSATHAQG